MKLKESLVTRRQFLQGWLTALGGLFVGQVLHPVIRFLEPPAWDAGPAEVKLPIKEYDLAPNSSKIFPFGHKPGLLIKTAEGRWIALSAVCTHFECTVHYDPESRQIVCPCHKGYYTAEGQNIKGPPPRPLTPYQVVAEAGRLRILRDKGIKKS